MYWREIFPHLNYPLTLLAAMFSLLVKAKKAKPPQRLCCEVIPLAWIVAAEFHTQWITPGSRQ